MKILLSFIGSNDAGKLLDKEDSGAIITVLKKRKYDQLFLLYNTSGKAYNSNKTESVTYLEIAQYIKSELVRDSKFEADKVFIKELKFEDISDHISVYTVLKKFLGEEFPEEHWEKKYFHCSYIIRYSCYANSMDPFSRNRLFPPKTNSER